MKVGTHFPMVVPGEVICGKRKSGLRRRLEHLAKGPPLSSSQNHKPNTITFVTQIATAA